MREDLQEEGGMMNWGYKLLGSITVYITRLIYWQGSNFLMLVAIIINLLSEHNRIKRIFILQLDFSSLAFYKFNMNRCGE